MNPLTPAQASRILTIATVLAELGGGDGTVVRFSRGDRRWEATILPSGGIYVVKFIGEVEHASQFYASADAFAAAYSIVN